MEVTSSFLGGSVFPPAGWNLGGSVFPPAGWDFSFSHSPTMIVPEIGTALLWFPPCHT